MITDFYMSHKVFRTVFMSRETITRFFLCVAKSGSAHFVRNKPENQDEDALGKIEKQQDCVILELGASIKVGVH